LEKERGRKDEGKVRVSIKVAEKLVAEAEAGVE